MTNPPRHPRDYGFSGSITNPEDGTPIREMFSFGERMLLITGKCTYALQMADQIDPKRSNPSLPHNLQQKLFDHGVESELLCHTLLQARVLFKQGFQSVDTDKALQLAFDALCDLIATDDAAKTFSAAERQAIAKAKKLEGKDAAHTIPAVGNVRAHCKTFAQQADHFAGSLWSLVQMFYPDMSTKGGWQAFHAFIKSRYGADDPFSLVADQSVPFLQLVRNARDCLEHINLEGVATSDFTLLPNGTIEPPSIEIDFRNSSHPRCPISWFMVEATKALQISFEMIVVHMCAKSTLPFAGMPIVVGILSEEYQRAWRVRFGYGCFYADGKFVPCG